MWAVSRLPSARRCVPLSRQLHVARSEPSGKTSTSGMWERTTQQCRDHCMVDSTIYRSFAAPSSKLPSRRVNVYCKSCGQHLAKYAKGNGAKSSLVKMYRGRIVDNLFDVGEGGEAEAGEGAGGGGGGRFVHQLPVVFRRLRPRSSGEGQARDQGNEDEDHREVTSPPAVKILYN